MHAMNNIFNMMVKLEILELVKRIQLSTVQHRQTVKSKIGTYFSEKSNRVDRRIIRLIVNL